ncbi:MAG: hypothetical protein ACKVGZ_10685 [Alphaproteobacteria bacterium]|jgi:hypothetical protein
MAPAFARVHLCDPGYLIYTPLNDRIASATDEGGDAPAVLTRAATIFHAVFGEEHWETKIAQQWLNHARTELAAKDR